jgi:hypothetical protein
MLFAFNNNLNILLKNIYLYGLKRKYISLIDMEYYYMSGLVKVLSKPFKVILCYLFLNTTTCINL